jgi:hypothetical protein
MAKEDNIDEVFKHVFRRTFKNMLEDPDYWFQRLMIARFGSN